MSLNMQGVFNLLNFENTNFSRFILEKGLFYIHSDLRLKLFYEHATTLYHVRNIIPTTKTPDVLWFDYIIYHGSIKESTDAMFVSLNIGIRAVLGQYFHLNNDMELAYYDGTNQSITTNKGTDIYENVIVNTAQPIIYYNKTANKDWLYFVSDMLAVSTFIPNFEVILYPATTSKHSRSLFSYFEEQDNETFTYIDSRFLDISSVSEVTINRPRFMFSFDRGETYHKFDIGTGTWTEQVPANAEYFTYNEFISKSNTYSEYLLITEDDWLLLNDTVGRRFTFLSNNYIFPIIITEKFWKDRLLTTDWYNYYNTTVTLTNFMKGSI